MKFQDSSFNGLKVTVGTKSVTHPPTHAPTHAPKAICPINFFKVGGIKNLGGGGGSWGEGCVGVRMDVNEELKFLYKFKKKKIGGGGLGEGSGLGGQGGCERRIEVFV